MTTSPCEIAVRNVESLAVSTLDHMLQRVSITLEDRTREVQCPERCLHHT